MINKSKKHRLFEQEVKDLVSYLKDAENIVYGSYPPATKWLLDKPYRHQIFEENPECFLTIKNLAGGEVPFFPMCNRMALKDPNFIKMAIKLASEIRENPNVDKQHAKAVIAKLKSIKPDSEE